MFNYILIIGAFCIAALSHADEPAKQMYTKPPIVVCGLIRSMWQVPDVIAHDCVATEYRYKMRVIKYRTYAGKDFALIHIANATKDGNVWTLRSMIE